MISISFLSKTLFSTFQQFFLNLPFTQNFFVLLMPHLVVDDHMCRLPRQSEKQATQIFHTTQTHKKKHMVREYKERCVRPSEDMIT